MLYKNQIELKLKFLIAMFKQYYCYSLPVNVVFYCYIFYILDSIMNG